MYFQLIQEFSLSTTLNGKVETTRARIDPKNNEEDITTSDGKMRVLEDYNRVSAKQHVFTRDILAPS